MQVQNATRLGHPVATSTQRFLTASRARARQIKSSPKEAHWTHAFFELHAEEPLPRRQALAFAYALEHEPVRLCPEEQLVGQVYQMVPGSGSPDLDAGADSPWRAWSSRPSVAQRLHEDLPEFAHVTGTPRPGTDKAPPWIWLGGETPGHVGWHWEWLLEAGAEGLFARLDRAAQRADERGKHFLAGVRIVWEALLRWNDRHVEALEAARQRTGDDDERRRLVRLLDICRRVPRRNARTFHEALQAFHFTYLATLFENPHGGNGPGRLDYHLWPYLKADLENGRTTLAKARLLIDELFIRFHERLLHGADGHVETIVVGGTHPDGTAAVNPLTRVMVESIAGLGITHPSVYIRMPDDLPEDLLELAAQDICEGGNRGQVVYDRTVVRAMVRGGIPEREARMYMCGGCMEISPQGMSGDLLFCGFFNVAKVLELVLTGGVCLLTGDHRLPWLSRTMADFRSFNELYDAFASTLRHLLTLTFRQLDIGSEAFARHRPRYLLSSQIDDCILRGRGIHDGGARYEDYGSTPLGIPNVADSLYAIRDAVFDSQWLHPRDLLAALHNDFADAEDLRTRLRALPKFGQGHAGADAMAQRVTRTVCQIYEDYTNRLGGRVKPMIMTFMMAGPAGKALGASADGRHAGEVIAHGVTPQNHAMQDGISTAMLSANALPLEMFSGGASSIWDLDPELAQPAVVKSLLRSFFTTGGQMFHGNATDVEALLTAQRRPEAYEDLVVRVGGFSARFVTLEDEIQQEVIARHRHTG